MKIGLHVLRAKIKGFAAESRSIRRLINKSSGEARHKLWNLKSDLGFTARMHLLAYAFLRGKPFYLIEKKSNIGLAFYVEKALNQNDFSYKAFTRKDIEAWLVVQPPETVQIIPKLSCEEQAVPV